MGMSETYSTEVVVLRRPVLAPSEIVWKQQDPDFLLTKRSVDIVLSLIACLVLLWWLLPILALLIKLDSKGPVFFVQQRVGKYGYRFGCIKLRTMVINREADHLQASANDPRITRLGKFLRLSCLDELPQFINVLKGEMSIVGPRPHMVNDCRQFMKIIPDYNYRHSMKPGITGMAQVKGLRGKTETNREVVHRYQWDCFYIRNASLMLDLSLIYKTFLQTIRAVVNIRRNAKKKEAINQPLPSSTIKYFSSENA
jgi:putative colanic acid biosysnthesis UDP-glucose lipid carrier transferase